MRQRHRHLLAGGPGPHRRGRSTASPTSASTASASTSRRCSAATGRSSPDSTSGRPARRADDRRAVGRRRHLPARAGPGRVAGWLQWNDRFRDDVRGFLRGEGGLVPALMQRVQGSPDVFDSPDCRRVNFLTCHDGFTLYDLVAYDRKHNEANGQHNHDGAGDNRSWNCGCEGDDGVPGGRRRRCAGASCATPGACWRCRTGCRWWRWATSSGAPRAATTTPTTRTTRRRGSTGSGATAFADLERFVGCLLALRHRHPQLSQPDVVGRRRALVRDVGSGRHRRRVALAGLARRRPLRHRQRLLGAAGVRHPGAWSVGARRRHRRWHPPDDIVEPSAAPAVDGTYDVAARSVVILERSEAL